ncbi:GNAT family N-acetyltransferase [Streptomyces sp. NPDC051364]|uniref:GNAT family N-acetyltransferase n=1 Tax=Streptomyces sp. NPDC051364 TaxID=3155799 RepID=UPI0034345DC0
MTDSVILKHHSGLDDVREDLIKVYASVRGDLLRLPNYRVETFTERLDRHGNDPGWEAVMAHAPEGEPIGYAYANTVEPGNRWWTRMDAPPPAEYASSTSLAIKEIGVVKPWRGQGLAQAMHDELLRHRHEEYVTLLVNPAAGEGKVKRLYEGWGYVQIGRQQPSPDSPPLHCLGRPVMQP